MGVRGGWKDAYVVSFTFRCEDLNKILKLERREEISVECVAEKDEFEPGDRCG